MSNCITTKDHGISNQHSVGNGVVEILGSIYCEVSDNFMHGIYPISRTVKAEKHDLGVVEVEERRLGNIYGFDGGNYAGNVYDKEMLSPTIRTYQGGNQQPMIVRSVGRNPDNPSDRTAGTSTEQHLEPNRQGICNTLTSVQKDNMVLENSVTTQGKEIVATIRSTYRIRKLTPKECWRLMGFSDEDFRKAESVNSNAQLYKQAGNSLVKAVMGAIMSQLNIKGVKQWNEMSKKERSNIIWKEN